MGAGLDAGEEDLEGGGEETEEVGGDASTVSVSNKDSFKTFLSSLREKKSKVGNPTKRFAGAVFGLVGVELMGQGC